MVTHGHTQSHLVSTSNSASASASVSTREELSVGTRTPRVCVREGGVAPARPAHLTPQEWTYLLEERAGILEHQAGLHRSLAEAQAWAQTVATYGPRPPRVATTGTVTHSAAPGRPLAGPTGCLSGLGGGVGAERGSETILEGVDAQA